MTTQNVSGSVVSTVDADALASALKAEKAREALAAREEEVRAATLANLRATTEVAKARLAAEKRRENSFF